MSKKSFSDGDAAEFVAIAGERVSLRGVQKVDIICTKDDAVHIFSLGSGIV